jgi:hypothetical protein
MTGILATIAFFTKSNFATVDASAYLDAILFGIIAWRIRRHSKFFAVAGLCLFIVEKIYQFSARPEVAVFGIIVAVLITLLFVSGVKGTYAYHRLSKEISPE